MQWFGIIALALILLVWFYSREMASQCVIAHTEGYADFIGEKVASDLGNGVEPELAVFGQGLPLADFLTPATALTRTTARACAEEDRARQTELGGQFVQRTNNYRRDYPDNCSAPLTEFVGAIYAPKDGVGLRVPCDGQC
jgi:hypothetical protein